MGLAGYGSASPLYAYDGTNWTLSYSIEGSGDARLSAINGTLWAGAKMGRAFFNEAGTWIEAGTTGEVNVFAFAEYLNAVYACTGPNGRIYRTGLPAPTPLSLIHISEPTRPY